MIRITVLEIAEPDQSGMGVWQIRDGMTTLGHIVAKPEAFDIIRDALKLLAVASEAGR